MDKKGLRIIRIPRERVKKNVDDRSCHTSVQGMGVGLTPFSLAASLQPLACNVELEGHTPESLAARSIALDELLLTSLEKSFHCVRIKNHAKIALN